jgi:hypothetical protein
VLSRFPIHNLTTKGDLTIHITQTNAAGETDLRWAVSYNEYYGPPRHLAYKLDTIVINQRLDALPRPLPRVLKVGSLRQIETMLHMQASGRQHAHLTRAFHQNASAYIVAKLRYRGRDGTERRLDAGFTRYSVLFTGDPLPDGTPADAVYLVLSEPYREVLTHAPTRPLDYAYLQGLAPMAQRCYEIVSYKIFGALTHQQPHATLRYSAYCLLSTQQRCLTYDQVKKQMYKVHQPHLRAGYLTQVQYEPTKDAADQPDWYMYYTPGAKARTEFDVFTRHAGHTPAAVRVATGEDGQEDLAFTVVQEPQALLPPRLPLHTLVRDAPAQPTHPVARPPRPPTLMAPPVVTDPLVAQAQALVRAFRQRFHGCAEGTAHPKELAHALDLLRAHGEVKAHFLLTYAQQAAPETAYQPQFFGGILPYLPRALAAYDAQTAQAAQVRTQQAAAREHRCYERYLAWQQEQCAQRRAALSHAELRALEDAQRTRLVATGTVPVALDLAVRWAIDDILMAQAPLPTFAVWRQQQEEGQ